MKKALLLGAVAVAALSQGAVAERWVRCTDLSELEGKECAIVWYYNGEFVNNQMPGKQRVAPAFENKRRQCVTMSSIFKEPNYMTKFATCEPVDLDNIVMVSGSTLPLAITELPENTAMVKFTNTGLGWTMQDMSADGAPYYSQTTADFERNYLTTYDTPSYNTVTLSSSGILRVTSTTNKAQNVFGMITSYSFTPGETQAGFFYCSQANDMGNMFAFIKESEVPLENLTPMFDPAYNFETAPTADGKVTINAEWFSVTGGTLNDASQVTASFNGTPLAAEAVTCPGGYPAKVEVALPIGQEGLLTINFPKGWYTLERDGVTGDSQAYDYKVNVVVPVAGEPEYSLSLNNGATYSKISDIIVDFNNCTAEFSGNGVPAATLNGIEVAAPEALSVSDFAYASPLKGEGTYKLTFPAGYWNLTFPNTAVAESPAITFTCMLQGLEATGTGWSVEPPAGSQGLERVKSLVFDFEGTEEVIANSSPANDDCVISYNGANYLLNLDISLIDEEGEAPTLRLVEGLYGDGICFVRIKKGLWTLYMDDDEGSEMASPEMNFVYYVGNATGVTAVEADGVVSVYDMNGVCVAKAAAPDAFRGLGKGIYVVNGKKVVVK